MNVRIVDGDLLTLGGQVLGVAGVLSLGAALALAETAFPSAGPIWVRACCRPTTRRLSLDW